MISAGHSTRSGLSAAHRQPRTLTPHARPDCLRRLKSAVDKESMASAGQPRNMRDVMTMFQVVEYCKRSEREV